MARKLNNDEERQFVDSLEASATDEHWALTLAQKRDKPLNLAPELEQWFGKDFPSEFGF